MATDLCLLTMLAAMYLFIYLAATLYFTGHTRNLLRTPCDGTNRLL
jgi:hypothetical protein